MAVKKLKVKSAKLSSKGGSASGGKVKVKIKKSKAQFSSPEPKTKKIKTKGLAGLTVDVFDFKGKTVGKVAVPKEIFQAKVNPKLMAQAVRVYLANQRQGTVSTKTRGEVAGSTRKLYRQKGTGRARAGSIKSPLRVGGGVVFGPKPRDFSLKLSKKMRKKALFSALTEKLQGKVIRIIDGLDKITPKTKQMQSVLRNNDLKEKERALLVIPGDLKNIKQAGSNIKGLDIDSVNILNTYDVLVARKIFIMKEALGEMEKVWLKS